MFVIDANKKNSGHGFDSVSGVYDFPMGGEYYTMFDHNKEGCRCLNGGYNYYANGNDLNIACTDQGYGKFFCDWSGKCDDYTDVAGAMVYTTDGDVLFPYHAMGNFCFTPSSCCYFGANCVYLQGPTIKFECMDAKDCTFAPIGYDLSNSIIHNIASRKQFKGGEIVGKKIYGDIFYMYKNVFCTYGNYGDRFYIGGPISVKMSIGLLHTDGTINDIFSKTITTRCYFDEAHECSCSTCAEHCMGMFIQGQQSTDGVIACAGDRLIYDIRFPNGATYCPRVRYRNSSSCIAALNLGGSYSFSSYVVPWRFNRTYCYVTNVFKPNVYCTNSSCYSCAWGNLAGQAYSQMYTQDASIRQNGITVSIE